MECQNSSKKSCCIKISRVSAVIVSAGSCTEFQTAEGFGLVIHSYKCVGKFEAIIILSWYNLQIYAPHSSALLIKN